MSKKKTHEEFLKELKEKNNNQIETLEEYNGLHKKIKVKFLECGHVREMKPSKLLIGQGCGHKDCNDKAISKARLSNSTKAKEDELKKLGYELISGYKGMKEMITVKNKKCGHTYTANAANILNGSGCPKCHGFKTTGEFTEQVQKLHGDEYKIIGEYINNRTTVKMIHKNCGNEFNAYPKRILNGKCCPTCYLSSGETLINEFLKNHGIKYERQYRFNDCRNKKPLPFDFAIFQDDKVKLIEFDGQHHYGNSNYWGNDKKAGHNKVKEHDKIKDDYCKSKNIELLRIPYWWARNKRMDIELEKFIRFND